MDQEQFELWSQHAAAEVKRAGALKFTVQLDLTEVLSLCADLQLALRHPGNVGAPACLARQIVDDLHAAVRAHGFHLLAAMIAAGDDPAQDVPREESSPTLIVGAFRAEGTGV